MTTVGQRERATQQRVVRFFIEELGYRYLGDWHTRPNNRNVEPDLLSHWLIDRGVPICSPYTQTIGQDRLPGWGQSTKLLKPCIKNQTSPLKTVVLFIYARKKPFYA